jgi:hypothetical protein
VRTPSRAATHRLALWTKLLPAPIKVRIVIESLFFLCVLRSTSSDNEWRARGSVIAHWNTEPATDRGSPWSDPSASPLPVQNPSLCPPHLQFRLAPSIDALIRVGAGLGFLRPGRRRARAPGCSGARVGEKNKPSRWIRDGCLRLDQPILVQG